MADTLRRARDDGPAAGDPQPYAAPHVEAALWPRVDDLLPADLLDRIAANAARADEEGELAADSLDALRTARYFGAPVPSELQGRGAGLLRCAAIQRQLGMADAALAIAVNMHLFSVGIMVEHWLRTQDTTWLLLEAIATQNRIVASGFAEPGLAGSILRSYTKATPVPGGYRVTGTKSPCSLAAACDLVCMQMELDPPEPAGLLVAVVPATVEHLRVERSWDALGMRGSGSDTLRFEGCFVPKELVFHRCEPGFDSDEDFAAGLVWFCVTTTATYLGVLRAALGGVTGGLLRSKLPYLDAARGELPTVQSQLGGVVAEGLTLELACTGLARLLDQRTADPRHLVPPAIALKHAAVEICTRAVAESAELLGARSYGRRGPLARAWRDVQALRFHPPTRLASRQILGRWSLGQPFSFELAERPPETAG